MRNMRVIVTEYGGSEKLKLVEEPLRPARRDEVRVRMQSAGVALADVMRREGKYPGTPQAPFTPGYDAVGIVEEIGDNVKDIQCGDKVAVFYHGVGGYATHLYARSEEIYPVPDEVDSSQAAAVILNYLTAYQMLHRYANVAEGERILIHGASGGTGTALLDLGRLASLRMYGTASAAKHDIVAGYGAMPIDYRTEDFVQALRAKAPEGMDAVFDPIGGRNWERSFATLNARGRFIGYGYTSVLGQVDSSDWTNDWSHLSAKRTTPQGNPAYLYSATSLRGEHPEWFREDLARVFGLLADGSIHPTIAARIPLSEAAKAHRLLETSQATGKIVLINDES